MLSYSNLLVIDLASYGIAFSIINQFCDEIQVKVFEVSPIGHVGIIILLIKDETAAEVLKNEILSFYKSNLISVCLLKNFDKRLLPVYLSQNKDEALKSMLILEFSFVSDAFVAAQKLLTENISLLDFRIIRAYPLNAILVAAADDPAKLISLRENLCARSSTLIENVGAVVKEYFQNS